MEQQQFIQRITWKKLKLYVIELLYQIKEKFQLHGTSDELKKRANIEEKITVEIDRINYSKVEEIKNFSNVDNVLINTNMLVVTYKKGKNNLGELIDYLKKNEINYNKIFSERPTLNDVFLELTGKELRD